MECRPQRKVTVVIYSDQCHKESFKICDAGIGEFLDLTYGTLAPRPQGSEYLLTLAMGLEFRRRFWEEDDQIFGGITNTNLDIGTIWYPSSGFLSKRGILIGYYNYFQGGKVHGDVYAREFETGFSAQWNRIKYSEGGWALWADRGENYRLLTQPQGRVYFAGDHLSYVTSWQHGAFESARQAVTDLHQRVLSA